MKQFFTTLAAILVAAFLIVLVWGAFKLGAIALVTHAEHVEQKRGGARAGAAMAAQTEEAQRRMTAIENSPTPTEAQDRADFARRLSSIESSAETEADPEPTTGQSPPRR